MGSIPVAPVNVFNTDLLLLIIFLLYCFFLSCLLIFLSLVFTEQTKSIDKNSAYECGFNAFGFVRNAHSVQFYRIAVLFLIFDVEIVLLFPSIFILWTFNVFAFIAINTFLVFLVFGYVYDWLSGFLEVL